jgi:hypothetical protein
VTAHLPGLEIEIFTVGHRVDGEQISINVRAVFFRETANPFCGHVRSRRVRSPRIGMRFKPPAPLAVRLAG